MDRMIDPREILEAEFQLLVTDLIDKYDELGMRASGSWAESLEIQTSVGRAVLLGNDYTEQLVDGRASGRFPPIGAIRKWIEYKGIDTSDITVSSLAFLIARKIAREGTEYFKQGGTDLIEAVITPKRIQRIINNVSDFYISSFTSDIKSVFEKLQTA